MNYIYCGFVGKCESGKIYHGGMSNVSENLFTMDELEEQVISSMYESRRIELVSVTILSVNYLTEEQYNSLNFKN